MSKLILDVPAAADGPFGRLPRHIVEDSELSFRARGLLLYLCSRPPGWTVHRSDLEARATEGQAAIATAIAELEERGLLEIERRRGRAGRYVGSTWVVKLPPHPDEPHMENPDVEDTRKNTARSPHLDEPDVGEPQLAVPSPGNQGGYLEEENQEEVQHSVSTKPAKPIVETKDEKPWNRRLAPLARALGTDPTDKDVTERNVGLWLRWAKDLGDFDRAERIMSGLRSLRERGAIAYVRPGEPCGPGTLDPRLEGQPVIRVAEAEYWRVTRPASESRRDGLSRVSA